MLHLSSTQRFFLAAFVILFFGIAIRFFKLGQVPVSLYWDEAAILVDAKSIAETGRDMHNRPWFQVIFPSYGDYKLPVYIWLASLAVKLFGVSAFAVRMPSFVAGCLTMVVGALLAKKLFELESKSMSKNKLIALSTLFVIAVSPWSWLSTPIFRFDLSGQWYLLRPIFYY
jgi:4-amino-4-deoxy-L-arabinose transferase-like glycosyltransferase